MNIIAQIPSPWIGDGTPITNPYRPQFRDDFPGVTWSDVTGTPASRLIPPVNAIILEITTNDIELSAIESAGYLVIWWEQIESPVSE